jgi:hypothetical protein
MSLTLGDPLSLARFEFADENASLRVVLLWSSPLDDRYAITCRTALQTLAELN